MIDKNKNDTYVCIPSSYQESTVNSHCVPIYLPSTILCWVSLSAFSQAERVGCYTYVGRCLLTLFKETISFKKKWGAYTK